MVRTPNHTTWMIRLRNLNVRLLPCLPWRALIGGAPPKRSPAQSESRITAPTKPPPPTPVKCGAKSSGRADRHLHMHSCRSDHVDEGIQAEQVDLAAHEVGNSRLRHPESFGGRNLCPPLRRDPFRQFDHQP